MNIEEILASIDEEQREDAQKALNAWKADEIAVANANLEKAHRKTLGKLHKLEPVRQLIESGVDPADIPKVYEERRKLAEQVEAMKKGVDPSEVDVLVIERVARELGEKEDAWSKEKKKLAADLEKERNERLNWETRDRHRRAKKILLAAARSEGLEVQEDLQEEFFGRFRDIAQFDEVPTGKGRQEELVFAIGDQVLQGEKGAMTPAEAVLGLYTGGGSRPWDSKGAAFFKDQGNGAGASSPGRRMGPPRGRKRSTMSPKDKADFIGKWGGAEYRKLPA